MKFSETANEVIALATANRNYWDTELPKRHPNYPLISQGEDSGPPPPEEKKLRNLLLGLPEEDIYKIALLMCLGRGDFGVDDLAENYEALNGTFGDPQQAASQMMVMAPLADYLLDGLEELRKHKIDVDWMPLKKVKVRKR